MTNFKQILANAEEAKACKGELAEAKVCKTWKKAIKHPKAPKWAYWYARHVIEGRWSEAEKVIAKDP